MPTLPKSEEEDAPSLNQIWALEAGGADQPGLIWAGSLPAALFRNDRNGDGDWQLVEGLWNLPERAKWFGGGTDDTGAAHDLRRSAQFQAHRHRGLLRQRLAQRG